MWRMPFGSGGNRVRTYMKIHKKKVTGQNSNDFHFIWAFGTQCQCSFWRQKMFVKLFPQWKGDNNQKNKKNRWNMFLLTNNNVRYNNGQPIYLPKYCNFSFNYVHALNVHERHVCLWSFDTYCFTFNWLAIQIMVSLERTGDLWTYWTENKMHYNQCVCKLDG